MLFDAVVLAVLYHCGLAPAAAQLCATGCVFVTNFHANRRFTLG
jgi:putative flippase GtrA